MWKSKFYEYWTHYLSPPQWLLLSLWLSKCTTCFHVVQRESKADYLPRACVQMCRTFKTPNTGLWSRVLAVTRHNDHWTKELPQREPKSICFSVDTVLCLGTIVHLQGYRRHVLLRMGRLQTGGPTSYSIWLNAVDSGYPVFIDSVCAHRVSCHFIYPRWKSALLCHLCDHGKHSHITGTVSCRTFCSVALGEQDLTIMQYSARQQHRFVILFLINN